jgi:ABC-type uncharacterized transport system permease subunit
MPQTAQRVRSAIGVAIVLAQFVDRLAGSEGQDNAGALATASGRPWVFVVVALLFALADRLRRRTQQTEAEPRPALQEATPRGEP